MKRRAFIPVLIVLLLVVLAAGAYFVLREEGTQSSGDLKIGFFIYRGDDTFITNLTNSFTEIAADYEKKTGEHIYVSVVDAQASQTTQNGQIERYLALDYDVLCVNLVDRTHAVYIIDKAKEANVPVIFFNREPVQADMHKWDRLYYVGTDAALNGTLEGQIVVEAYNKNPSAFDKNGDGILQYIMIEGEFRHQDAVLRTEGTVQAILDAGIQMEKLDGGVADWERNQASALAATYFEKYGDQIELIICNNDDMALGVLDMVDELGLDFTNIVGIDGTPQGLEAVEQGKMLGTVIINYPGQAQLIFDIAAALLRGENPADTVDGMVDQIARAPMFVITRDEWMARSLLEAINK